MRLFTLLYFICVSFNANAFRCDVDYFDRINKEVPEFCEKDMYFQCGKENTEFKAVLNLKTHGAGTEYRGVILKQTSPQILKNGEHRIDYTTQLWVTDRDGDKFYTSQPGYKFTTRADAPVYEYSIQKSEWVATGQVVKKGTLIHSNPESDTWIPQSLRGLIKADSLHTTRPHAREGTLFRVGPGNIKKFGGDGHNYFTFYAIPNKNVFKLFWVVGMGDERQRHTVKCRKARLKK